MSGKLSRLKSEHTRKNRHARFRDALGTPSLRKIVCGETRVSEDDEIESDILPCFGRTFDSFINHLTIISLFCAICSIYFGSGSHAKPRNEI